MQTVSATTAINEVKADVEFSMYPNPTSKNISIDLGKTKVEPKRFFRFNLLKNYEP
jgi:hypothetical protein